MSTSSGRRRLSTARLIAYAGPALPLQALLNPLIIFLPPFYASEVGVAAGAVGLVFMIARAWDALTDPIVGAWSDRTRSRFGRRKPWILAGLIPLLPMTYWLLVPGDEVGVLRLLVLIALFYAAWTCVVVPYQSWGAEMSTDYFEKGRIASYREAGTVLGIMIGIGVPLLLLDPIAAPLRELIWGEPQPFGSSQAAVLEAIAWLVIVMLPITVGISLATVPDPAVGNPPRARLSEALRVFVRNPPFARLLAGYFFAQLGFLIYLSLVVLFITRVLELRQFLLLVFLQHMAAVIVIPFWQRLFIHIGKHRAYVWSLLSMMASLGLMALVEPGALGQAIVVYLLLGIGSGAKLILPPAMAADAVDLDTLRTGRTEAGLFMALLNMTNKATFALSVGIGYGLMALSGFDPASREPQPAAALEWLTIGVPIVVMGIGCAIMWNYPLDARRQDIIRRRLASRRMPAG